MRRPLLLIQILASASSLCTVRSLALRTGAARSQCTRVNATQNGTFDFVELVDLTEEQKAAPGLIITGQGGSATRAAQEMANLIGTHAFGSVDEQTGDSFASRWEDAFAGYLEILSYTGSADYEAKSLPRSLRVSVEERTCATLLHLKEMVGEKHKMPLALKEPRLRFFLPFYSALNMKLVHVTRDVRRIRDLHNDPILATFVLDLETLNNKELVALAEQIAHRARHNGGRLEPVDAIWLGSASNVLKAAHFAHAWATIELQVHDQWMREWPENYFHLSELSMANETTKRAKATALARFLGRPDPDKKTLTRMMNVYRKEADGGWHWDMMQEIVTAPSSGIVRTALTTFGYQV